MRVAMFFWSTLLLAVLNGCTTTTSIPGSTVDKSYLVDGFRWQSGAETVVFYKVFKSGDQVGVCGAWGSKDAVRSNVFNDQVLDAGIIRVGGVRILQGVRFMANHGAPENVTGNASVCRQSSVQWREEFEDAEPELVFPAMTF